MNYANANANAKLIQC